MRAREFIIEDNPDYDEDRYLKSDPGTPLSFPKGTTLVNVSDVYDWYKLGMAVSDLDDADPRTFNKGVPHTVFAFGSEEEEHKMIPLLKRLGFSLHDIDSPEDYAKAIRADEAIAHLEEMVNTQLVTDGELPDLGSDTQTNFDWEQQIGMDAGAGLQRAQGNLPGGINLNVAADAPDPGASFMPQKGVNISKGPASVYLGDKGAVSGSYNIPIDDRSSVSLSASGQKDFGVTGVGAQYQRGGFSAGINQPNFPGAKPQFNVGYSAQFEQALDEMAGSINVGISQYLAKRGYQYLGGGIDKQAYLEPNGQVYIVFGYRKGIDDFSPDQRMFINWITYCNKNKNNPHLPRFSAFETFKFQGKNYIQARMEPLKEADDNLKNILAWLDIFTREQKVEPKQVAPDLAIRADSYFERPTHGKIQIQRAMTADKIIEFLGGEQTATQLLDTVHQVQKFGKQHGYSIDLHGGNYMLRDDGTIVVNDPFVLWLEK
jgi:hypothetical protein